ncbi:MAG: AAA family ATPase [Planctomycetia bacterium]|nr:AAA family ATPase [Planctomycetia bacterium]
MARTARQAPASFPSPVKTAAGARLHTVTCTVDGAAAPPGGLPAAERRGVPATELAERVQAALRERIGAQRYELWFADGAALEVLETPTAGCQVRIVVQGAFALEWLQRSFHADVVRAVVTACGHELPVAWVAVTSCNPPPAPPVAGDSPAGTAPSRGIGGERPEGRRTTSAPQAESVPAVAPLIGSLAGSRAAAATPSSVPGTAPRLTMRLEAFVVGAGNRMACTAIEMALERPGQVSPLVIVGPGGCGKTHLLEGLCQRVRDRRPSGGVVFSSAEQFTTAFLQSLHGGGVAAFRRGCRGAEVFVIDDLQFFAGRNARVTVTELLHTIEAVLRRGRQVVLAADRDVDTIVELGPELRARLAGGMTARIQPADETLRRGIVAAMAAQRGIELPVDVVAFIATRLVRHPRELAGAVNRLEATSLMLGTPITLGLAAEALADLVRSCGRGSRLADIDRAVCTGLGLAPGSLQSRSRGRAVNHPRMLAMFLARRHTSASLMEIGAYFGRRSHSTVLSAHKTVTAWLAADQPVVLADASWRIVDAITRIEELLLAG